MPILEPNTYPEMASVWSDYRCSYCKARLHPGELEGGVCCSCDHEFEVPKPIAKMSETRQVQLGDILSQYQINMVVEILQRPDDYSKIIATLKEYLGSFKDELLAKGVVSDYLAYWLIANREMIVSTLSRLN